MTEQKKEQVFKLVLVKPLDDLAEVRVVGHGDRLTGLNVVGILEGSLCSISCGWCNSLLLRIKSRTVTRVCGNRRIIDPERGRSGRSSM